MPSPVLHSLVRKPRLKRISAPRPASGLPLGLRLGGEGRPRSALRVARVRPGTLLARARRALHEFYALVRDREPHPKASPAASPADLVEARLMSDHWRHRAEAAEARAGQLESLLAAAEIAALDLRSRIICLQGKLATATATTRYQTMALALEHGRTPLDSVTGPV